MSSEDGRLDRDRAGSIASSHTEAGGHDEFSDKFNEKSTYIRDDESLSSLKSPTVYQDSNHEEDIHEDDELLPAQPEKPESPKSSSATGIIWIVVNTLATVGIVSPRGHPV